MAIELYRAPAKANVSFECGEGEHEECTFATLVWDEDGPYYTKFCDCECHRPNLFERSQAAPMEV